MSAIFGETSNSHVGQPTRMNQIAIMALMSALALASCGSNGSSGSSPATSSGGTSETPSGTTTGSGTPRLGEAGRLSQVTVSVESASIASDKTTLVTASLFDNHGKKFTDPSASVVFNLEGGLSSGTFAAVTNNGDGTFTATLTGIRSGSASKLTASVTGFDMSSPPVAVTVLPGTADPTHSSVAIDALALASGTTATATVVLRDAHDNITTSSDAITFSVAGGTSDGTFASVTSSGSDYSALFTGTTAGTPSTIAAKLDGIAMSGGLAPTITVIPGSVSPAQSSLTSGVASVTSGSTTTLTLIRKDAAGNIITSGSDTVVFTKQSGVSSGTFSTASLQSDGSYTSTFTGTTAGSAATIGATINGNELTSPLPTITVTPGPVSLATSLVSATSSTVASGSTVTARVTTRDAAGNAVTTGGLSVAFSMSGGTSTGTLSAALDKGNGTYEAELTGIVAGTDTTLNATIGGSQITSSPNQTITVIPGPASLSNSLITASANTVTSGATISARLAVVDANGNPLNTGGLNVIFSNSGGTSTVSFKTITDNDDGTYDINLSGLASGTATTIKASIDGSFVTSGPAPTVTVTPGSADADNSTIAIGSSQITGGATTTVTVTAMDINGNTIIQGGSTVTFSLSGGTSTAIISPVTDNGDGTYTATLTGQVAGTATTVSAIIDDMTINSAQPTLTVNVGTLSTIKSIIVVSASSIDSGTTATVTLTAKDLGDNLIGSGGRVVGFTISGGSSTGTFNAVTDNGDGTYTSTFTGIRAGTAVTVNGTIDGVAVTSALPQITVYPSIGIKYELSGLSGTVRSGIDYTANILVRDLNDNLVTTYNGTTIITSTDTVATLPSNYTFVPVDGGGHDFTIRLKTLGAKTVTFKDLAKPTITVTANLTVVAQDPDHLVWSGSNRGLAESCLGPITLTTADPVGNTSAVLTTKTVTFSGLGSASLYTNSSCTTTATSATIASGATTANLYIKDNTAGNLVIIATTSGLTSASLSFQVKPIPSWVGNAYAASAGTSMSGTPASGRLNGQMINPYAVVSDSGFYYVADYTTHRVMKFDAVSNAMIGWIGGVGGTTAKPTGGASGCTTTTTTGTPGWCTGGFAASGTGNNQFNGPRGLAVSSSWLYIADSGNHRIVRVDAATGAFGGWTGTVNTVATGGTTGCTAKAIGAATAGWCTGGTAKSGTGDGMVNAPRGLTTDGTYLYVADYSNFRVSRFFLATGVFDGWIGLISTAATGGATGCSTATLNTGTPGWCLGGTAKAGTTSPGQFKAPTAVMYYGGNLYVTGSENAMQRILTNVDNTISVTGWYGRGSTTSPTGGATGCTASLNGLTTPGWCVGGLFGGTGASTNGQLSTPTGLTTDGTFIYIADQGNSRVSRVNLTSGAYGGSIGRVTSVGTGGTAGCTTLTTWGYTPGWCIGATPTSGLTGNAFNSVAGVTTVGSYILAADQNTGRVMIIDQTTGQPSGWLGAQDSSIVAWTTSSFSSAISTIATGGYGFASSPIATNSTTMSGLTYDAGTIYVTDTVNHRVKSMNATTGATTGWIGSAQSAPTGGGTGCSTLTISSTSITPTWCTGGTPRAGTVEGAYSSPQSSFVYGAYIYVADTANHRVVRINKSTGVAAGWIGNIKTVPTDGGTVCTAAAIGTTTPAWCTGGTSQTSTVTGSFNTPAGITSDGTHLYVVDSGNSRIEKFNMTTGAVIGWMGRVLTVPTGGDTGCTSLAVGAVAQMWCTGGTAQASGTTAAQMDGAFKTPRGITFDGTWLYVADLANHRITRHTPASGAYGGWSGAINASPTGGTTGCAGATIVTPGWCTGGTSKLLTTSGFNNPRDIAVAGSYYYVADSANNRVVRFTTAGVYSGWKGIVLTAPIGGDTGCVGATIGKTTPGWCTGGTSQRGLLNGSLDVPVGITSDGGTWLYVTDGVNGRIVRLPIN